MRAKGKRIVVIGAGHNGLVLAYYLAKAGFSPIVLERRHNVGGLAITEEVHPGFLCSTLAHSAGPLLPSVWRDLQLERHGLEFAQRLVHPVAAAAIKRALQDNIAHQMDCRRDIRSARCGCGQLLLALPVRRHAFTPCAVLRARAIQAAPSCPW